jgi:hypothetical protein
MNTDETQTFQIEDTGQVDVLIPHYEPLQLPYSQWRAARSKQFLEVNNVSTDSAGLINGTEHASANLREAAYFLLTEVPDSSFRSVYFNGVNDTYPAVQALAAYALAQLGDTSHIQILDSLSLEENNASVSIYLIAGLCGRLGKSDAFSIIESGVKDKEDYIQLIAISYAHYFCETSDTIDYWKFYQKAVKHKNERVRLIARMQLEEFDTESSRRILENLK